MGKELAKIEIAEIISVLLIVKNQSIGRYALSEYLNTSKARTRLILHFLIQRGWAVASRGRGGTKLTKLGNNIATEILKILYLDFLSEEISINPSLIPRNFVHSIVLLCSGDLMTNGLFERDLAVRMGASGAITLVKPNMKWLFADQNKFSVDFIHDHDLSGDYNMAIIVFAETRGSALRGALSAALYHSENEIKRIIDRFL